METKERIREKVSNAYARAVSSDSGGGCCGPACRGGEGEAAPGIGASNYSPSDLEGIPREASARSLGCGNPLAFGEIREGETVLDLGSGAGLDLSIAAKRVGPAGRVIGIDMTDETIRKAERNVAASGRRNVEVRKGLVEELPVEDGTIDWVISNCVVNLSPEKERVFAEIFRVLKPGGRFRISDIVVEDFPARLRDNESLYISCIAGAIGEEEYLEGLRRAGLVEVEALERARHDVSQLRFQAPADLFDTDRETGRAGRETARTSLEEAIPALEGKVYSALLVGRKPESA